MQNRFFFIVIAAGLFSLILLSKGPFFPHASSQSRKPSQALKKYADRLQDLQESFDRDVSDGKAQPYDWESNAETLRQLAASEAAQFNIPEWKENELLALASLFEQAEMFSRAADVYRERLKGDGKPRELLAIRLALARSLIEAFQFVDAQRQMDELFKEMPESPLELSLRTGLMKDLAAAWRDQGKYDLALKQARRAYDLADNTNKFSRYNRSQMEATFKDQMSVAAIVVASQERLGFKEEAAQFHARILKRDFRAQPELKSFYESELMTERMLGRPAPEMEFAEWIGGQPRKFADLRGKVVLVDFWAMWCGPCVAAFPHWRKFQTRFNGKGFEIIGVTKFYGRSDTTDELSREQELKSLQSFKDKYKLDYPFAIGRMDEVMNEERYGIAGLPAVVLIDRRGNVRHINRNLDEYRKLEKKIELLVNEN